jgi:TRAP-type C4-dicarboxylate transport system substrate-binding protein
MELRMRWIACWWWVLVTACGGKAANPERETWRFAIEETRGSVQHAYALEFKRRLEAETHGAVELMIYPYGELGTSDHLLEQLHNGSLQFAMSSPGHLGKLIPAVQVFLLHFTLSADESVNRCALASPALATALDGLYAQKGLAFLDAFSEGFMVWTTRAPVRSPNDFEGVKFRVMTSPLLLSVYAAYGANPTPLPYSEVYSALQLHMIDGQVNPLFAIQEMSFHEVSDWLTFAHHASFVTTVASSQAFLSGLSPARRALVRRLMGELHAYIDPLQQRLNGERLQKILAAKPGLQRITLAPHERAAFAERARPVRERFVAQAGEAGRALLATLDEAVASCAP